MKTLSPLSLRLKYHKHCCKFVNFLLINLLCSLVLSLVVFLEKRCFSCLNLPLNPVIRSGRRSDHIRSDMKVIEKIFKG